MVHFYLRLFLFVAGVILGVLLAKLSLGNQEPRPESSNLFPSYETWFKKQRFRRKPLPWDVLRYDNTTHVVESNVLYDKIRVICVILVRKPKNAEAAVETWAKGCNDVKFVEIITRKSKIAPFKRSKVNSSWVALCNGLKGVSDKYDWVLVVNDNTFAIVENLRRYVAPLDPSGNYYLGHVVTFWNTMYNSNQAGYVLSRGAMSVLKENLTDCLTNLFWNREDFYLGKLLARLNIGPMDTRDLAGHSTFNPYNWYQLFFPKDTYYKSSFYPVKCCSKYAITFQAIEGDKMYTYYYILYKLQLFLSGKLGNSSPIIDEPDDKVWKRFLKERNIPSNNITSQQYYEVWERLVDDPTSFASHMKKETHFDYD